MKKVLGLDLGTNSIGWALIEQDFERKEGKIIDAGSRIIPMSQDILGKFDSGQSISQTAERTNYRGVRRLYQRDNLRRERLHRVLNILGFLPEHYKNEIDFDNKLGQFKKEIKINYRKNNNGKYEFIFTNSFNEMVKDFKDKHPDYFKTKRNGDETKIPYDWTIYYLRKKALKEKIRKEELAWILLNFNQKRGYYQLRGEEEEIQEGKEKTFEILKVKDVIENGDANKKGEKYYTITFENGWKYDRPTKNPNDWLGKTKEFIVTTTVTKSGDVKRTYKAVDSEKDWEAIKKKTEQDIEQSGKFICEYIYDTLLTNPKQKIRGKLIKTIERKYYKNELKAILKKQIEFYEELNISTSKGKDLYLKALNELYKYNDAHKNNISSKGFDYLFIDDIIFYQRPLKSQKSNIGGCQYEYKPFYNEKGEVEYNENGNIKKVPLKAISKSHPLFQEFRLWQFIHNLRIYQKEKNIGGKIKIDVDVTNDLFTSDDDWEKIFDFLNDKKEVKQLQLIDFLAKEKYIERVEKDNYRWNYVEDKTYPMSDTRAQFISRFKKVLPNNGTSQNGTIITTELITNLWHIIYSVSDKEQYVRALKTFANKNNLDTGSFVSAFEKFPPFKSDYASLSEKAIKKLLPLMRIGKYWNKNDILPETQQRIEDIIIRLKDINFDKTKIETIADDDIQKQVLKSFINIKDKNPLKGLNTYQATYAVYGRHSEVTDIIKWETPDDINKFLDNFKQHSLRNPIVEQIITETLRTVRDIWKEYGDFSEIHLELGREMKNPADKRKQITQRNTENENTNQRIKQILRELMSEGISDVKDYSPSHQEILKIYEEGIYQNPNVKFDGISEDEINKIRKNPKPSQNEIARYKLWLEQGYISPYTGKIIPLSSLFTTKYQIEHIIPQSRYFDNSLSNKIICESEVNQLKGNLTAYEFIKNHGTEKVDLGQGRSVEIFGMEEYETHCKRYFAKNKAKLKKLLSEDIPENFIERQINDTRYISKYIKSLLSNIVREDGEQSETSKNLIPITGAVTSRLKQDWGLNDKWNEIIQPRFERLNKLTGTKDFTYKNDKGNIVPTVPDELQKGFNKKRIDHRHHALDAIVIANTTRKHIQYLNSLNNEQTKYELQPSLLIKNEKGDYTKYFQLPWQSFPVDVKNSLENIIVSFKQNLRVINKATNKYQKWVEDEKGQWKKKFVEQKGQNWAIRKPLHKETVDGKVFIRSKKQVAFNQSVIDKLNKYKLTEKFILVDKKLAEKIKFLKRNNYDTKRILKYFKDRRYKFNEREIKKVAVYYYEEGTASRKSLSEIKSDKQISSITDKGIVKILKNHLKNYIDDKGKEDFEKAFSPEGIEQLNKNIIELNGGKNHQPIYKVRLYEVSSKFSLSDNENSAKHKKYVEAAKGTNLFFNIYVDEKDKRQFETVPLNEVIAWQKWRAEQPKEEQKKLPFVPVKNVINEKPVKFLFSISPNDLVYIPTDEEVNNINTVDFSNLSIEQKKRVYKIVSFTSKRLYAIPSSVANSIYNKFEFTSLNKIEFIVEKDRCLKLEVNRLGQIISIEK
jgi:CRISPR-associated endonuclease Csn1